MKVLFIEDQPDVIEPIRNQIDQLGVTSDTCEFYEAEKIIRTSRPDIVILDLASSASSIDDMTGRQILDFIWKDHFCPVIVYSAYSDQIQGNEYLSNPFVESVKKGRKSINKVCSIIETFRSHVEVIKAAENEVRSCFAGVMKDIAPYAFKTFSDSAQRVEKIKHAGRRRIAALMDEPLGGDAKLAPWELYLFPPISSDIRMGDLLVEKGADRNNPNVFRVVLTPSCDLVPDSKHDQKLESVLTAKCCSMKIGLKLVNLEKAKLEKIKTRLLNPGYHSAIIPFPALPDRIPLMAANLRDLHLISIKQIENMGSEKENMGSEKEDVGSEKEDVGSEKECSEKECSEKKFCRVASIDSPFREMIAWAYMQIACRPGEVV